MPKVKSNTKKHRAIVAIWDLTIKKMDSESPSTMKDKLNKIAKKWCFQLERGEESGYLHWQVRVCLHKKTTINGVITLVKAAFGDIAHVTPTSSGVAKGGKMNYVMKDQTRVEGPWKESDNIEEVDDEIKLPLKPHQQELLNIIEGPIHPREIIVILDKVGGHGKSWFSTWLRWKHKATVVPPFDKMEDIMQMVMCKPADRCYVIDVPRQLKTQKLASFYAGIEQLKNGICYDKRHHYKDRLMKKPHVIIFTNNIPDMNHLSNDRWRIIDWSEIPPQAAPVVGQSPPPNSERKVEVCSL